MPYSSIQNLFRINRYKIAFRLFIMTAITGGLFASMVVFSLAEMKRTRESLEHVTSTIEKLVTHAQAIRSGVNLDENAVLNLIVAPDLVQKSLARVRLISLRAQVAGSIDYMLQNDPNPSSRELTAQIQEKIQKAYVNQDRLIQIVSEHGLAESMSYYQQLIKPELQELTEQCDLFAVIQERERDTHYGIAAEVYSRSRFIFLGVSSLLLVISVWLCVFISKGITRPIDKAVRIADRLAENAFDFDIDLNDSGEPGRLLAAMKQMAERLKRVKELEQQLVQSQKLETVGKLAGGVAHDFNNLLTAIFGHCELALADSGHARDTREHIEGVLQAAQRAASLTHQLLAFSRRQVLKPELLELNRLIGDLTNMLKRLIPENIELQVNPGETRGSVKVDRTQIEQVILNLVVNARDALPDGGRIVIETGHAELDGHSVGMRSGVLPGRYVLLSVSDNGVGMTPEVQARIFEPFFTTKELGRGTGLGLSTVYGIVKQSGGNIWVYSETGLGTTFKLYFPLVDGDPAAAPSPRQKAPDVPGGETILLVEDDWEVCKVVASLLSGHGYRILVAEHAQNAISMAESSSFPIDLLLTDMVMPGMNGDALAEAIQRLSPGTTVLYMSGYTDHRMDMDRKCCNGGDHFIQKPFTADALLATVRSVIDGALAARSHLAEN